LKKLSFIVLAVVLALSLALVGCGENGVVLDYDLTITSSSGGSTFPAPGTHTYQQGQTVNVRAEAASEFYEFVNWTGADAGELADANAAETSIVMNADYSIQANFQALPWDEPITLTLHPTISQFASICGEVIFPWVDEVNALVGTDGGTFNVEIVTPGDSPYDAASSLSAITLGTTDIGMLSPETFHLGGAGYMPFEFDSIEQAAYVMYHLFTEDDGKWDAEGQLDGVKILITMPLWGSQLWTTASGGVVDEASDLQGLKIRTDAQYVESATLAALGAVPTFLGVADLAGSLESGVIDGCFFTYSGIGGAADLGPVTAHTTELNMIYRPYSLAMNLDAYEALPADAKAALDSVSGADASVSWATAHIAAEAEDRDGTENGPCFMPPPPTCYPEYGRPITVPDLSSFIAATENVSTDWAAYLEDPEEGPQMDGTGILARIDALKAAYGG
jgi:TRAP-type C4-dicarboxylate transport system substrate-binding protein